MSAAESRAVPYYCPFCAGEDLWPAGDAHGQWECRSCARGFALRFVGLTTRELARSSSGVPTSPAGGAR